jgi:hypothetical protein
MTAGYHPTLHLHDEAWPPNALDESFDKLAAQLEGKHGQ